MNLHLEWGLGISQWYRTVTGLCAAKFRAYRVCLAHDGIVKSRNIIIISTK
jgi:hypothetical protein